MLPMGWNQIRQARVSGMNHPPPQQMPYGSMGGPPVMPNQQQFNMYRPPVMQPPPSQMYGAPTMMGHYGMPNPQVGIIGYLGDAIYIPSLAKLVTTSTLHKLSIMIKSPMYSSNNCFIHHTFVIS